MRTRIGHRAIRPAPSRSRIGRHAVREKLEEAILAGRHCPGEKLLQQKLAGEHKVAQAVVREALVELEAREYRPASKKWVRIRPNADPDWLLKQPRLCDSRYGGIDICNAIKTAPSWKQASATAITVEAFGLEFLVLGRDALIKSKLAAGREQDLADVAELNEPEGPEPY